MGLDEYLKREGVGRREFAGRIGAAPPSVTRYCNGRVPEPEVVVRIYVETAGAVQPNDFYPLPALGAGEGARR